MSTRVTTVFLVKTATGEPVEAELKYGIQSAELLDWKEKWMPALTQELQRLHQKKIPREKWPQSAHWNWETKVQQIDGLLAFPSFSITCQGVTQGLMIVNLTKTARLEEHKGKPLVYVEYVENAPWNRPMLTGVKPTYKGVGSVLIGAAIQLSIEEAFKGRLGLHSLPQANEFYGKVCGMCDLGPDPSYQNLRYFEMNPEQAQQFIDNGKSQ